MYLFISCQALGLRDEMKEIVADLGGQPPGLVRGGQGSLEGIRGTDPPAPRGRKAKEEAAMAETAPAEEVDLETQIDEALEEQEAPAADAKPADAGGISAAKKLEPLLTREGRKELAHWRNLAGSIRR